jgi:hypothetical protein
MQVIEQVEYVRRIPRQRILLAYLTKTLPSIGLYKQLAHPYLLYSTPYCRKPKSYLYLLAQAVAPVSVIVPNVIGEDLADAVFQLNALGFTSHPVTYSTSLLFPPNTVMAQNPPGLTVALFNTPVALVVSTGPGPGPVAGFRVMAVTAGEYNGEYYAPGDVFDLLEATDFSDSTVNYGPESGTIQLGWMIPVSANTPLYQAEGDQPSPTYPAVDPARRFVY